MSKKKKQIDNDIRAYSNIRREEIKHERQERESKFKIAKWTLYGVLFAALIGVIASAMPSIMEYYILQSKINELKRMEAAAKPFLNNNKDRDKATKYLKEKHEYDSIGKYDKSSQFGKPSVPISDSLEFIIHGIIDDKIQFSISSPEGKTLIVNELYIRLEAWAECSLRNEYDSAQGFKTAISKMYNISEDYGKYPIVVTDKNGVLKRQSFTGRDSDYFEIGFKIEEYKLYQIALYIDYYDTDTPEIKIKENSKLIPLIKVKNGNSGGCLDIESWWKESLNKSASSTIYGESIPREIYAFLSENYNLQLDIEKYTKSFYKTYVKNEHSYKSIIDSNPVFTGNSERLHSMYSTP